MDEECSGVSPHNGAKRLRCDPTRNRQSMVEVLSTASENLLLELHTRHRSKRGRWVHSRGAIESFDIVRPVQVRSMNFAVTRGDEDGRFEDERSS